MCMLNAYAYSRVYKKTLKVIFNFLPSCMSISYVCIVYMYLYAYVSCVCVLYFCYYKTFY